MFLIEPLVSIFDLISVQLSRLFIKISSSSTIKNDSDLQGRNNKTLGFIPIHNGKLFSDKSFLTSSPLNEKMAKILSASDDNLYWLINFSESLTALATAE